MLVKNFWGGFSKDVINICELWFSGRMRSDGFDENGARLFETNGHSASHLGGRNAAKLFFRWLETTMTDG
jgi:hypothetical protein